MENNKRRSLVSWRGSVPGGRAGVRLRVYALGDGLDAQIFFSMRLWQAAADRQARLSVLAPAR